MTDAATIESKPTVSTDVMIQMTGVHKWFGEFHVLKGINHTVLKADRSRSRETGGTGLGLTVAQSVIRAHGGTIALSNRADRGLRVEATLPR